MTSRRDTADVDPVYVRAVLDAYRCIAATTGHVRANDRRLAVELYRRGVPLATVTDALLLATARRLARPKGAAPLGLARSLSYFSPVIDELLAAPLAPDYRAYLAAKVARLGRQSG
jgi:hypothetical protein